MLFLVQKKILDSTNGVSSKSTENHHAYAQLSVMNKLYPMTLSDAALQTQQYN